MLSTRFAALTVLAATVVASAAPVTGLEGFVSKRDVIDSADSADRALAPKWTPTGSSLNTNTCTPLELVYFRSSLEPQDRLGLLGDPLYAEILKSVPRASAYNVIMDTALGEQVFTNLAAAKDASDWVNRRSAECPSQRYIVAGFSKGAVALHMTVIEPAARERVVASLAVADFYHNHPLGPFLSTSWPSSGDDSIVSLCNPNDAVCSPGLFSSVDYHVAPAYLPQLPATVKKLISLYRISRGEAPK